MSDSRDEPDDGREPAPFDPAAVDPEPVDPAQAALRLRASDADREKVADVLREAYAEGRLTRDEHDERLGEAYHAATYGDLLPVLRDLPVPPGTVDLPGAAATPARRPAVQPGARADSQAPAVAIFSGFERKGQWTVPATLTAVAVFGGGEIDVSDATLTAAETVITVVALFGGINITVPPGLAVRNEVVGVFGGTNLAEDVARDGTPVIVVKGAAIFGGVDIKAAPRPQIEH